MKIHEREMPCNLAEREIRLAISEIVQKHELTSAETYRVVLAASGDYLQSLTKLLIRAERHGNTDIPGGLAGG